MVDLLERPCLPVANVSAAIHLKNYLKDNSCAKNAGVHFQLSSVHTVDLNSNKKGNLNVGYYHEMTWIKIRMVFLLKCA